MPAINPQTLRIDIDDHLPDRAPGLVLDVQTNFSQGVLDEFFELGRDRDFLALLERERLIRSWNFETDEGQPVPCEPDSYKLLPAELLTVVYAALMDELRRIREQVKSRAERAAKKTQAS